MIAPPFGLLAHDRVVSKDLSAFADLAILADWGKKVKNFFIKNPPFSEKRPQKAKKGAPIGAPRFLAAAIGIAAAAVMLTAAAEQDQQDDDPAQIAAAEAVVTIVTHKDTSMNFDVAHRHSSHVMIQEEKCAPVSL